MSGTSSAVVAASAKTLLGDGDGQIPHGSIIAQAILQITDEAEDSGVNLIRLSEPESLGDPFAPGAT